MFGRTGPPSSRPSSSTLPPSLGALFPYTSPSQTLADLAYLTPSDSVFAAVWMYTLSHWGDPDYQLTQVRLLALTCSSSSSSSVDSQNFLEALANPLLPLCRRPLGCHLPGLPRLARLPLLAPMVAAGHPHHPHHRLGHRRLPHRPGRHHRYARDAVDSHVLRHALAFIQGWSRRLDRCRLHLAASARQGCLRRHAEVRCPLPVYFCTGG